MKNNEMVIWLLFYSFVAVYSLRQWFLYRHHKIKILLWHEKIFLYLTRRSPSYRKYYKNATGKKAMSYKANAALIAGVLSGLISVSVLFLLAIGKGLLF